jgi:ribosome-binding factor A
MAEVIAHQAADFFARESNYESLITVTRAEISPDLKNVTIYISVLPEAKEQTALAFAKRVRTDFRDYMKDESALRYLPTIDFALDYGEKNRQRIDDLTRN